MVAQMFTSAANSPKPEPRHSTGALLWAFRAVITLNFVHFALSFVPGFEASSGKPGIADKIFGKLIVGTLRVDFAWLIVSTIVIFASTFYFAKISENDHRAHLDVFLGRAWTVVFVIYVLKSIFTGVLYPG
jgi:hypothetical protein